MQNRVRYGDTGTVTFTIKEDKEPVDLSGASVQLLARKIPGSTSIELPATLGAATGTVLHQLSGELPVGVYLILIKVIDDGVLTNAPTEGYEVLYVDPSMG